MVHEEQQRVFARVHLEQPGPDGDFGGEVEAVPGGGVEPVLKFGLSYGLDVERGPGGFRSGCQDQLVSAVGVLGEEGAQALVAGDHVAQRGP